MYDEMLENFFLVGGTALSLQIGHRISIDIDLFSISSFDEDKILTLLEKNYNFQLDFQSKNTLKGEISGIKIDLITHNYPLVNPLLIVEDVRMASALDIAAMKLNAISGNGTRLKDFIDIAYLSSSLSLTQMINGYEQKYDMRNPTSVVKSLDYHQDINFNEPIELLNTEFSWKEIEIRLRQMTLRPLSIFKEIKFSKKQVVKRGRGLR
jgi:hypothetical protein